MSLNYSFNTQDPSRTNGLAYYETNGYVRNVSFVCSDRKKRFLNYAYLISGELSSEENSITLTFTTHSVTLRGHNLDALYDAFTMHSLRHIAPVEERYKALQGEAGSYVTHIEVRSL